MREEKRQKVRYYTIIDGSFRVQVDQNDPEAVQRDWESADGKSSGTKYERIVNSVIGYIESIQFYEGEYGTEINVGFDMTDDGYRPIVALKLSSREGEDFLKKLPNIDLLREVRLRPFNFNGDEGDEVRGMDVRQEDEHGEFKKKIKSYFQTDDRKSINGYPVPEGDPGDFSKDDWKIYFLQTRKFLKTYTLDVMTFKIEQAVDDRSVASPKSLEQQKRLEGAGAGDDDVDDEAGEAHSDRNATQPYENGEVDPKDIPF